MHIKVTVKQYMASFQGRTLITTLISTLLNALTGIVKLVLGMVMLSPWIIANSIYYLLLGTARGQLLNKYRNLETKENTEDRYKDELAAYRKSGLFLCLIGLSYLCICLRMYYFKDTATYSELIIYVVALLSFVKLGCSISGIITSRRKKTPALSAMKIVGLADACLSIVMTRCSLLMLMGADGAVSNSSGFGMAVSVVVIMIGTVMLIKYRKAYNSEKASEYSDQKGEMA